MSLRPKRCQALLRGDFVRPTVARVADESCGSGRRPRRLRGKASGGGRRALGSLEESDTTRRWQRTTFDLCMKREVAIGKTSGDAA